MRAHAPFRFALLLTLALAWASPAWALFELTASPRKGGRDIRFDAGLAAGSAREEELTLTVESDAAVPYQILIRHLSPLTNEQGKTLPQDALVVFSPTNSLGDVRLKVEAPLPLGQTVLYSSNSSGASDQLTLVFHLNLPEDMPGGLYRASLSFTLEPQTPAAGIVPRTVTLDVRVESKPAFRFAVRSDKGSEKLDLGRVTQKNPVPSPGVLTYQIESNVGQPYRVYQELRGALVSEAGTPLPEESVSFSTEGEQGRAAASGKLSEAPVLLYESDPLGTSAQFRAAYQAQPSPTAPAGRYNGMLLLRVESSSPYAAGQNAQLPVALEIEPVFNLDIDIPDGFGLQFGNLRSGEEAPEKRVFLKVRSNLGQPYQVSQLVTRRMSTGDGYALPDEAFRYSTQKTRTGSVEAIAVRPVPAGESAVFLSDPAGTPEELALSYFLTIPSEAKSGPYGTEIKYSITTL